MKSAFEKSMLGESQFTPESDGEVRQLNEFLGIETFGKAKDWLSRNVNKSLETNRRRDADRALEKRITARANRQAQRRDRMEARMHPERFVNSGFSKNMQNFENEATNRRNEATTQSNQWMNDAEEGIADRNDHTEAEMDWEQGDVNAFMGNRQGGGQQPQGQPQGQPGGQPQGQPGGGQQPQGQPGGGQQPPEQPQGQPGQPGGGQQPPEQPQGQPQEQQLDPKVQAQVDNIQKRTDAVLTAIKSGKVNGNTVRQQITPLNKALAQLVQQVEAKKNSAPAGKAVTKAMASKPQAASPAQPPAPEAQNGGQPQQGAADSGAKTPVNASYEPVVKDGFLRIFEKEIFSR